jgi:hypothetical protein
MTIRRLLKETAFDPEAAAILTLLRNRAGKSLLRRKVAKVAKVAKKMRLNRRDPTSSGARK